MPVPLPVPPSGNNSIHSDISVLFQIDTHCGSYADRAFYFDPAPVQFYNFFTDAQTETDAAHCFRAGLIGPIETVKDLIHILAGDADTGILYCYYEK
jgi:hypothetical protein